MAGGTFNDILGKPRRGAGSTSIGRRLVQDILTEALGERPQAPKPISILGRDVDLNTATTEQVAALTQELDRAKEDTSFSGATEAFDVLDIPGAFVRGVVGAGISLGKGEFKEAGFRALSALPGSENIPKALGLGPGVRAPEGSELLADVGWEQGTTAEDERRIRIATLAGMSRGEARQKFATLGKPVTFETQREFDSLLDRVKATNPAIDTGVTFEDTKKAADAQDVAGVVLEIALDPLTYFTLGASAAGKAARLVAQAEKAGGKGLLAALKGAGSFDEASKAVRALDVPGFGPKAKQRLLDTMQDAFKGGKPDFDLGRTLAEQAQRGQRRAGFKIPFGPEFGPELSTRPLDQVLSTVGQSKLARELSPVPAGVSESVHQFLTEAPVIGGLVKGARAVIQKGRDIADKTGVATFDQAFKAGMEFTGQGLSKTERELNAYDAVIRKVAKERGMDEQTVNQTVGLAIETFKARSKAAYSVSDPKSEKLAADFALALSRTGLKESEIAPIAAGIAAVQADVSDIVRKAGLDLPDLGDSPLSYLHRHATEEGKKWLKTEAESSAFEARIAKWKDMTIPEINRAMEKELGPGTKFFTEDPVAGSRKAISEAWRALGNAYTANKIAEGFGSEVAEGIVKNSAADIYKTMGLKMTDAEMARLSKIEVPEEIHKATMKMVKAQDAPGKFVRGWRKLAEVLKATVTLPFPAFHGRNMLENTFKSLIEDNANPENFRQAAKLLANVKDLNMGGASFVDAAGRKMNAAFKSALGDVDAATMKLLQEEGGFKNLEEFVNWANGSGVLENRFTSEFGMDMRQALRGREATRGEAVREAAAGLLGAPLKAGFAVASGTENWYRLSMFIDRLKKGLGRDGALNEVRRVFFDYRDLGKAESQFAKNFGFFYNFYRHNMRYIVQKAMENPQLTKQITKLFRDDPDNPRWSWMSDKAAFKVAGFDVSLGFLPQQQFNMFDLSEGDWWDKGRGKLGDAVGQLNPMIESALSGAFNKDLYRNQDLSYVDRAPDWTFAPQWVQTMIGLRQTSGGGYVMSPKWRWLLDSVPALGRFAQSQIAAEKEDRQLWQTLAQVLAGVRIEKGDIAKESKALLDRNIKRAGTGLEEIREDGPNAWRLDLRTEKGRQINALVKARPEKEDLVALASNPEIIGRLQPYISVNADGEPVMNRLLVAKMNELGMELYPKHWALMRAQQARKTSRVAGDDIFKARADEAFAALFGRR